MAEQETKAKPETAAPPLPTLEEMQHWTWIMGRAQQMMLEHVAKAAGEAAEAAPKAPAGQWPWLNMFADPAKLAEQQVDLWTQGMEIWTRALGIEKAPSELQSRADRDKRFNAPEWRDNPLFDMIRQSYLLVSERLLGGVDAIDGIDKRQREKLRFLTRSFIDAMAPSNFALTNPLVIERALETKGESLLKGLEHMLDDLPQTYAHGDASPQNLLLPADEPGTIVVIDWGFGTLLPVGFDLGQLLVGLAHAGQADPAAIPAIDAEIFPAYLAGLAAEDYKVDPAQVRAGYLGSLAARSALCAIPFEALENAVPGEQMAAMFAGRMKLTRLMLDMVAEPGGP